ncbi:sulfur carrier protein ThiS [Marinimicrobium alkaliphilum]|uniref:sulfur carrier protein ThiS n=1 Tax=Marinimicrobium alkaliphilum TaxID=2202654 RepID=UPI001E4BDDFA|nr:sulfur carrier protein ThiS [Marinimicrobium alkaliphilum]
MTERAMIDVSLNNERTQVAPKRLLSDALNDWGYGGQKVAIAINGEFVPRSRYAEQELTQGDKIDIVKPIGGG